MSGFFCNSPRLQLLERQMRQPPGYRPRGQGWMFDMEEWKSRGNYSEIVDCVISRMQMEHLKKRIQEVFGNAEKELIFYDSRHRNDFSSLLLGRRKKNLCGLPNYAAAVFLLSADENLWEKVSKQVLDTGIYFDRIPAWQRYAGTIYPVPCGKGCVSGDKAYPAVGADRQGIDTG